MNPQIEFALLVVKLVVFIIEKWNSRKEKEFDFENSPPMAYLWQIN